MFDIKNIDLKKEIRELKKLTGEERGEHFKYLVTYVREKEGEEELVKLISELKKNGYELPDSNKINNMDWILSSIPTIFMVASVKFFNWQEEDIVEMGRKASAFQTTIKLFIRYFLSTRQTFKKAANDFRKHYSFGTVEIAKYDSKKKMIVIRLKDFKKHPVTCLYLRGIFSGIIKISTGSEFIESQETKCIHRGDHCHEFIFNW